MEEVIGARHDHNGQVLRARPGEDIGQRDGLVVFAVDHERVTTDVGHRPLAGRATDQHEMARRMMAGGERARRARSHEAAEREPGERERQSRLAGARRGPAAEGSASIRWMKSSVSPRPSSCAPFAARRRRGSSAAPRASRARRRCAPSWTATLLSSVPPYSGMRMPHVGDAARRAVLRPVERELDAACRAVDRQLLGATTASRCAVARRLRPSRGATR